MFSKTKIFAAALLAASAAAVVPASADAIFSLENFTFSDGGTASGQFSFNVAGGYPGSYNITTTAGSSTLPGYDYMRPASQAHVLDSVLGNPRYVTGLPAGVDEIVQLNVQGYKGYLQLAFVNSLTAGTDPLVLAYSFECSGYAAGTAASVGTCNGTKRDLVAPAGGKIAAAVPEPASLSLLGFGLLAAGYVFSRRRKQQLTAV